MLNHEPSRLETLLEGTSLIVSAQASTNAAVDDPETLWKLAKCSLDEGVRVLRLQGVDNIRTIKAHTGSDVRVIGLIKQDYDQSEIYITPTRREVSSLLELGCEVIALDASARSRPDGSTVAELVEMIHQAGALAMADCDSSETIDHAVASGCDLIGTTLAGYTPARAITPGPDFELVRYAVSTGLPVIAEGRYAERWEVEAALRIGAQAVVIGGAINDPVKQTRKFIYNKNSIIKKDNRTNHDEKTAQILQPNDAIAQIPKSANLAQKVQRKQQLTTQVIIQSNPSQKTQ
jgi:putative N-acetylmannosamine-6-phosphate epimerase